MQYIDDLVANKVKQLSDRSIVSLSNLNVKQQIQMARSKALGHMRTESASDLANNSKLAISSPELQTNNNSTALNPVTCKSSSEFDMGGVQILKEEASINENVEVNIDKLPFRVDVNPNGFSDEMPDHVDINLDVASSASGTSGSINTASNSTAYSKDIIPRTIEAVDTIKIQKKSKLNPTSSSSTASFSTALDSFLYTGKKLNNRTNPDELHSKYAVEDIIRHESLVTALANTDGKQSQTSLKLEQFGFPLHTLFPNNPNIRVDPINNKQTLVMKICVPTESARWSINICPPAYNYSNSQHLSEVLLHFNPRLLNPKSLQPDCSLVVTSRCVRWSRSELKYELSANLALKPLFGSTVGFELMIQVCYV